MDHNAEKPDHTGLLMDLVVHKIHPMEVLLATMRTPAQSLTQKLVHESKDILIMKINELTHEANGLLATMTTPAQSLTQELLYDSRSTN